jgi:hypothetical protein
MTVGLNKFKPWKGKRIHNSRTETNKVFELFFYLFEMILDIDKKNIIVPWNEMLKQVFYLIFVYFISFNALTRCVSVIKSTQKASKQIDICLILSIFIVILQLQNRSDILSQQHIYTHGRDKRADVKWIIKHAPVQHEHTLSLFLLLFMTPNIMVMCVNLKCATNCFYSWSFVDCGNIAIACLII